jgi:hypothetical protein
MLVEYLFDGYVNDAISIGKDIINNPQSATSNFRYKTKNYDSLDQSTKQRFITDFWYVFDEIIEKGIILVQKEERKEQEEEE